MSFQETLVSKKQKNKKKYSKCTKTKIAKKTKIATSLIAITTTKRDLKFITRIF
jgi:hypothetical protein